MKRNSFLKYKNIIRAATVFSVAVFLCREAWAEKPLKKVRPEAEAEAHFLKKDRAQASTVLLESIKKLGPTSEKRKQLSRQLDQFLEMFYTEAAQKIYEQGNSLYAKEPALALEKFEEAKRLEPDNVLVLENIARLNIHSKSCGKASEELKPVLKLNPYRQNALVLMLKAFECSGDLAEAEKFYTKNRRALEAGDPQILITRGRWLLSKGRAEEALKTISKAIETDAGYPEAYYWRWKILISMDQVAIAESEKYLSICQSPQPRVLRKYKNTPQLCAEVAAVREYVEKDLQTREGP